MLGILVQKILLIIKTLLYEYLIIAKEKGWVGLSKTSETRMLPHHFENSPMMLGACGGKNNIV